MAEKCLLARLLADNEEFDRHDGSANVCGATSKLSQSGATNAGTMATLWSASSIPMIARLFWNAPLRLGECLMLRNCALARF
jgi:hypothetical protein